MYIYIYIYIYIHMCVYIYIYICWFIYLGGPLYGHTRTHTHTHTHTRAWLRGARRACRRAMIEPTLSASLDVTWASSKVCTAVFHGTLLLCVFIFRVFGFRPEANLTDEGWNHQHWGKPPGISCRVCSLTRGKIPDVEGIPQESRHGSWHGDPMPWGGPLRGCAWFSRRALLANATRGHTARSQPQ